ncbi:TPA: hypothetical protein ACGCM7_005450 [Klebsiella pneumoniae]
MDDKRLITYKELSELLNIKVESAKALRRRHNWRVVPANQGREFLVEVPLSFLNEIENRTADMRGDLSSDVSADMTGQGDGFMPPHMLDRFEAVYKEIGELQARLTYAENRVENYEELKAKANALEADARVLTVSLEASRKDAITERERREKAEKELSDYKSRGLFQRLFG